MSDINVISRFIVIAIGTQQIYIAKDPEESSAATAALDMSQWRPLFDTDS